MQIAFYVGIYGLSCIRKRTSGHIRLKNRLCHMVSAVMCCERIAGEYDEFSAGDWQRRRGC